MTEPIRWKNCNADAATWRYGRIAQEFFNDVVEPALDTMDAHINKWTESDDPVASFHLSDLRELRRATTMAFCLSIQSIWERQIRAYLSGCAHELREDNTLTKKALKERWDNIGNLLYDLRGIHLRSFYKYRELDLLHLLSNVCRHGDGPSAKRLWCEYPEFWPDQHTQSRSSWTANSTRIEPPSTETIDISRCQLRSFIGAITSFWEEMEYIYLENIQHKHESLEKKLVALRKDRAKKGEVWRMCASVEREC